MSALQTVAKFWIALLGIILILAGIETLFHVGVPSALMGVLLILDGILALIAS